MKLTFLILFFPLLSISQTFDRVSVFNATKFNTFRVSIYEDEIRKITVELPPKARISIESRSDRKYKIKSTPLTQIDEDIECEDCYEAPRDKWGRAIVNFYDDFQLLRNKVPRA